MNAVTPKEVVPKATQNDTLTIVLAVLLVFSLLLNAYLLYATFVDKQEVPVEEDDSDVEEEEEEDTIDDEDETPTESKTVTGYIYSYLESDGTPRGEKVTTVFPDEVTTSGGKEAGKNEISFPPLVVESSMMKMTFTSLSEGEYDIGFSEYEQIPGVKNFSKVYRVKLRGEDFYYYTNTEITTKSPGCSDLIEGYVTPPCGATLLSDKITDTPGSGFIISIKCEAETEEGLSVCDEAVINLKVEEI